MLEASMGIGGEGLEGLHNKAASGLRRRGRIVAGGGKCKRSAGLNNE